MRRLYMKLILFLTLASCKHSPERFVTQYLENKYPRLDFEIINVSKVDSIYCPYMEIVDMSYQLSKKIAKLSKEIDSTVGSDELSIAKLTALENECTALNKLYTMAVSNEMNAFSKSGLIDKSLSDKKCNRIGVFVKLKEHKRNRELETVFVFDAEDMKITHSGVEVERFLSVIRRELDSLNTLSSRVNRLIVAQN